MGVGWGGWSRWGGEGERTERKKYLEVLQVRDAESKYFINGWIGTVIGSCTLGFTPEMGLQAERGEGRLEILPSRHANC